MNTWQKPQFEELVMNAEIGAYQSEDDQGERRGGEQFVQTAPNENAPQRATS